MSATTRRRAAIQLAAAVICLLSVSAAVAAGDTVKLGLPHHIKIGKPFTIRFSGFASAAKTQISLLSDKQSCRRSWQSESGIRDVTDWSTGVTFLHGHFSFTFRVPFASSTKGPMNFCAYLIKEDGATSNFLTTARTSLRFRIPS